MIKLFFFFLFQTNLFLRPYSTGKNQFQIMISPFFFLFFFSFSFSFSNKLVFAALFHLGALVNRLTCLVDEPVVATASKKAKPHHIDDHLVNGLAWV
jgi:hypothetical protein